MANEYPTDHHALSTGGLQSVIISFVFTILATIAVILRFYVRRMKPFSPFAEDWLIVAALVFDWTSVIMICLVAFDGGLGWQLGEASPTALANGLKYALTGEILFNFTTGFVKVSICVSLMRVFPTRNFRIIATIIATISVVFQLATMLKNFFICKPLAHYWNKSVQGYCGNETLAYALTGAVDLLTDIAIFLLPLRPLSQPQVPPSKKFALYCTFAFGLLRLAAGALRVYANIITDFGTNFVHSVPLVIIFTITQAGVGIIVSCLILMRPLLDRLGNGYKSYRSGADSGNDSAGKSGKCGMESVTWIRTAEQKSEGRGQRGEAGLLSQRSCSEGTFLRLSDSGDEMRRGRCEE